MADLGGFDFEGEEAGGEWPTGGTFHVVLMDSIVREEDDRAKFTFVFDVEQGPNKGRRVYVDCLLRHPNEKARAIGIRNLKQVFKALGFDGVPGDSTEAHGMSCGVELKLVDGKYINLVKARKLEASEVENPFA
jgi:hypothetical protein